MIQYQERFGETKEIRLDCRKRLGRPRIEISIVGERFNPFETTNASNTELEGSAVLHGILTNMGTGRTTKMDILWKYVGDKRFGITDFNRTEAVYNSIKTMTLADVVAFQQSHIKGRKYAYCILGDKNDVDMKYLKSLGKVEFVTSRQIFGY